MSTQPRWSEPRHCQDCKHFGHWIAGKSHVWCLDGQYVQATPATGCVYWRAAFPGPANAEEPEREKPPEPKPRG